VPPRARDGPLGGSGWLREPPARPEPTDDASAHRHDVLTDHVVFEIECINRMYCNVYVPQLQHPGGLLGYIQRQLGLPIASTAPLGKISDAFSTAHHAVHPRPAPSLWRKFTHQRAASSATIPHWTSRPRPELHRRRARQ
jgi:hypothetical protein